MSISSSIRLRFKVRVLRRKLLEILRVLTQHGQFGFAHYWSWWWFHPRISGPLTKEIVVRAIFESRLPVISSVGHETDVDLGGFCGR